MMSIRQRREIRATEVSEDFPAQEENVKLENKLPSGCTSRRLWKILSLTIGGTLPFALDFLHLSTLPRYMKMIYGFLILRYGVSLTIVSFTQWDLQ
uniref:Uncharacterized protein n=1 Tax=Homo sapiens TaxID=9606 RepID=Q7Z4H5_HUMAN|nr:unknown protein [Homo sapiens]